MNVVVITLLAVGILLNVHQGVDGATCTTVSTCQATDVTLSTCTSGVCDCINSSYGPIRTGCGLKKVDKAVIKTKYGESQQVIEGKSFTLTCVVDHAYKYEWYLGGAKLPEITSDYTQTRSNSSNVGVFTCKGIGINGELISELNDAFTVDLLTASSSTSIQPAIYLPATTVQEQVYFKPECYNIPMGFSGTITFKVNGTSVVPPFIIDSISAEKPVTCEVSSPSDGVTFTNPISVPVKLPSIVANIQSVNVTVNGDVVTDVTDVSMETELMCTISPKLLYLIDDVRFTWQKDGSDISAPISGNYFPTSSGSYSCKIKLTSQPAVPSSNTVKFTTSGRTVLTLSTSATKPIIGGRVILKCGDVLYDQGTYTWIKDNLYIYSQSDRKLQLDDVALTDGGEYYCTYTSKNKYLKRSNKIKLSPVSKIETPTISISGNGDEHLSEKGDYNLTCNTDSETIGMTYEWTFAGNTTSVTGKYYSLPAVTSSDNGDYTCKAKFKNDTSNSSSVITVTVTNPGLECAEDNFCIAARTGYTGICDKNDRCVCADGYTAVGEECSRNSYSGVVQIVGSVLIVTAASLLARFIEQVI